MIPENKIKEAIGTTKVMRGDSILKGNKSPFDKDKDGYIDAIDCAPRNPNKDGFISNAFSKAKDKFGELKKEYKEKKVQEKEFRRQAKEEEEKTYAYEREKYLKEQARKKAKERARQGSGFSAFANNLQQASKVTGGKNYNNRLSSFLGVAPQKKSKKKGMLKPKDFNFRII